VRSTRLRKCSVVSRYYSSGYPLAPKRVLEWRRELICVAAATQYRARDYFPQFAFTSLRSSFNVFHIHLTCEGHLTSVFSSLTAQKYGVDSPRARGLDDSAAPRLAQRKMLHIFYFASRSFQQRQLAKNPSLFHWMSICTSIRIPCEKILSVTWRGVYKIFAVRKIRNKNS
jgi:hypothetical protein